MKAEIDDMYTIFLLKKNIRSNITKMILGYLCIAAPETLKEQKMAITSVRQEYKSTESRYDYRTGIGVTYGGKRVPIDIGKSRDNFDKDGKPKFFNYNTYRHMTKDC